MSVVSHENIHFNHWYQITRVAGTSAGSIAALCLALGDDSAQLHKTMYAIDFATFADGGNLLQKVHNVHRKYGFHPGRKLFEWVRSLIGDRCGNPDLTFAQLHELAQRSPQSTGRKYRDLWVVGTSMAQQSAVVFSHEDFPNLSVAVAIRISTAIPVFFQAVSLTDDKLGASDSAAMPLMTHSAPEIGRELLGSSQTIKKASKKGQQRDPETLYVDGGVCWNLPSAVFDLSLYTNSLRKPTVPPNQWIQSKIAATGADYVFNFETLCLDLVSDVELLHQRGEALPSKISSVRHSSSSSLPPLIASFVSHSHSFSSLLPIDQPMQFPHFLSSLFDVLSDLSNNATRSPLDQVRTVEIPVGNTTATQLNLTDDRKQVLIANGREAVSAFMRKAPPVAEEVKARVHAALNIELGTVTNTAAVAKGLSPRSTISEGLQHVQREGVSCFSVPAADGHHLTVTSEATLDALASRLAASKTASTSTAAVEAWLGTPLEQVGTRESETLTASDTVLDALGRFGRLNHSIVVTSAVQPVGIFNQLRLITVLAKVMSMLGWSLRVTPISALCDVTRSLQIVDASETLRGVIGVLHQKGFSALPVCREGVLVGTFSCSDLRCFTREDVRFLDRPVLDWFDHLTASKAVDVQSTLPVTASSSDSFESAIYKMAATRVKRLWVVNTLDRPIGVLTIGDIVRYLANPLADAC